MDIGIDLIFSLDGIAVPPTKRDTHAGSQTDCGVGLQGGTLRNDKLKCETGHGRPGERWAAAGCASPHGEERGEDVEGRATDGRENDQVLRVMTPDRVTPSWSGRSGAR
jgi:hypothetical protein